MDSSGSVFWFALIQGWFMATATSNGPLKKMRLFIINTFQSAADQLCSENDEDRWLFCVWLTCRCRLVYFTHCYCLEKRSYAVGDGLSGFLFWELLKVKKRNESNRERLSSLFDFGLSDRYDAAEAAERRGVTSCKKWSFCHCEICGSEVESPKLF